jgi:ABC-type glutathione transport system ATPase component
MVVLHDLTFAARWADKVMVMKNGALHAAGSPDADRSWCCPRDQGRPPAGRVHSVAAGADAALDRHPARSPLAPANDRAVRTSTAEALSVSKTASDLEVV